MLRCGTFFFTGFSYISCLLRICDWDCSDLQFWKQEKEIFRHFHQEQFLRDRRQKNVANVCIECPKWNEQGYQPTLHIAVIWDCLYLQKSPDLGHLLAGSLFEWKYSVSNLCSSELSLEWQVFVPQWQHHCWEQFEKVGSQFLFVVRDQQTEEMEEEHWPIFGGYHQRREEKQLSFRPSHCFEQLGPFWKVWKRSSPDGKWI